MKTKPTFLLLAHLMIAMSTVSLPVSASLILLDDSDYGLDIGTRLTELGHSVTQSDSLSWDANFDYSIYDVVAFQFGSSDPFDINNLTQSVMNDEVGVVFFRGYGAENTAEALGMTLGGTANWQPASSFEITDNTHTITAGLSLGSHELGYTYMSSFSDPGANASVLASGLGGAALVVHNQYRVAINPFYGHTASYDNETEFSKDLTNRTIEWAATAKSSSSSNNQASNSLLVPEPATLGLLALGLVGLGFSRIRLFLTIS